MPLSPAYTPCDRPRRIAVLGSIGFLGPYIVAALLRRESQSEIICLNRSTDGQEPTLSALERLGSGDFHPPRRLSFTLTDITNPNLDGSHVSNMDEVIFNAWSANWGIPLESFGALLDGVRNVIQICAISPRRPRIIFMLSTCAIGDSPLMHPEQPLLPEEPAWDTASATENGYGQSKCIARGIAEITATDHSSHALHVYNMLHPDPAPWDLLYKTLKNKFGLCAKEVSLPA
jgi:nucleoside-diphosphate-sugar epimerase